METSTITFVDQFFNLGVGVFIVTTVIVTQILKVFEKKAFDKLGEKGKDVVFMFIAGAFVAIGKYFGFINLDWDVVVPLMFSPHGTFLVVKKIKDLFKS